MERITASVGIAKGKQCYNVVSEQKKVQSLLSRIKPELGGCEGKTDWTDPVWGKCAPDLHQAILNFQKVNRFRLDYDPDGHVDPHDATIVLLNQLADGNGEMPGTLLKLDPQDIDRTDPPDGPLPASGFHPTGWRLEGSGAGGTGSALIVTGGGGSWNLSHNGDAYTLHYAMVGVAASPVPVSASGGPASMPSTGTSLWTYGSRPDLDFDDIRGPLFIVGGAATLIAVPTIPIPVVRGGGYIWLIWFNAAMGVIGVEARALTALAGAAGFKSKLPGIVRHLNESAGAVAALVGAQVGSPDASIFQATGMAW